MRRCGAGILVFVILCSFLGGILALNYALDFPEKVKELINENKEKEFQMTYQDQGYLYLLKGYGKQETGGYSIQIEDLSLWENAIHIKTVLMGPEDEEELTDEPSYPCLVVKMKYREEPVIFE